MLCTYGYIFDLIFTFLIVRDKGVTVLAEPFLTPNV